MELDGWGYESCTAEVAEDKEWATIYSIRSRDEGLGHATELVKRMKKYYSGKKFGCSTTLHPAMRHICNKLNINIYD